MVYNIVIGALSNFGMKLLSKFISEKMLTKIFFYCARRLAAYTNTPIDDRFVEDEGWHRAAERYASFLHTHRGGRILYLELGVGFNTPGIIKYPFWQRVAKDPNAVYVCINAQEAVCPQDIAPRALCIRTDIAACLETLCG